MIVIRYFNIILIDIINNEYYCQKIKEVNGSAITFKSIIGTEINLEIYKILE